MDPLEQTRLQMVALLKELTTGEGMRPTLLDGVKLTRISRNLPRTPVLYEPSIVIVASGRKRGYVGDCRFTYDPNNYLVLSLPLPFECETEVGDGEPMLGVSIDVDMTLLSELTMKMGPLPSPVREKSSLPEESSVRATPIDLPLGQAAIRLLESLRSPGDAAVLGPSIIREITYRVLCGERGCSLRRLLGRSGQLAQVHQILQRLHGNFARPLDVSRIAEESGMSVSALHHHFKAVTSTSPVQYLKSIRLHKARMLMAHEGLGAGSAAVSVGYQSASQFSREFKRFFGHTPAEEAENVRAMLGISAPREAVVG